MKEVYLNRIFKDEKESLGVLFIQGDKDINIFRTLELPDKNNQHDISCISSGRYLCQWTFSPHFNRFTYQVMNVPQRDGIRIHAANYFSQLLGCIALGEANQDINNDGELDIINSQIAINRFSDLMNKEDFMLTII